MDLGSIAAAIATRFSSLTPPTGYADITVSTHRLPERIVTTPTVLVFPPEGSWSYGASTRTGDLVFPVRFYAAITADLPRAVDAAYAWHDVLLERLVGQVQLGESAQGVTHANMTETRVGLLTYPAPGLLRDGEDVPTFMGIETGVLVHIAEGMTYTA